MTVTDPAMRPVFLFGSGWCSGTTLLQRYINSCRDVFVWGENHDLLRGLVAAFDSILERGGGNVEQERQGAEKPTEACPANLNPGAKPAIEAALRGALVGYYTDQPKAPRWGFRAVHYHSGHAELLFRLFPDARIIFLVRNPADMLASVGAVNSATEPAQALALWSEVTRRMAEFDDPRLITVRREDLSAAEPETLTRIAEHLAVPLAQFDQKPLDHTVRGIAEEPALDTKRRMLLSDRQIIELARRFYPDWMPPSLARASKPSQ